MENNSEREEEAVKHPASGKNKAGTFQPPRLEEKCNSKTKPKFAVKLRQLFSLQLHSGTSAPEPSVLATFSSPAAQGLTAPGKTEKTGQPDDALVRPHSSSVLPTVGPVPAKSTAKMQTVTSVPSGAPTNDSATTVQSRTAAPPSTTAAAPGENKQRSTTRHVVGFGEVLLQKIVSEQLVPVRNAEIHGAVPC